jgi:hypothetical protein
MSDAVVIPFPTTQGELRVTDPTTGGQKGKKLAQLSLIPTGPLLQLAEHYGRGAAKYSPHQWRRGVAWSLCYDAMMRHALAFWGGEELDPETGSPHLAAVAWHAFALLHFCDAYRAGDDRPAHPQS